MASLTQRSKTSVKKDVALSKRLAKLLRHDPRNLTMQPDGYIKVNDILNLQDFQKWKQKDILRIVNSNDKQRFSIQNAGEQMLIRANQGHSVATVDQEQLLERINNPSEIPCCIHGTYIDAWEKFIHKDGLNKMQRQHIHCAVGTPEEKGVISGMRSSCELVIYIDVAKAMQNGLVFYKSSNNVILTEGPIQPDCFTKCIRRKDGINLIQQATVIPATMQMNKESKSQSKSESRSKQLKNNQINMKTKTRANYRFPLEATNEWKQHLQSKGYCVIANTLNVDEIETSKVLIIEDLERLKIKLPVHGLVPEISQSAGAWKIRGNSNIKKAFEHIWQDSELITSMDCVIVWRRWNQIKKSNATSTSTTTTTTTTSTSTSGQKKPRTEGLHLDQNPFHKPNLECVQGMVPLFPVNKEVGGLVVVEESHTDNNRSLLQQKNPKLKHAGDWCPLPIRSNPTIYEQAMLIEAEAGDLILWDSRTIHGGRVGNGSFDEDETVTSNLVRMSVTVSMTQKSRASSECLALRRQGFLKGACFNHSPHEAGTSTGTIKAPADPTYVPIKLSQEQWQLLDGSSGVDMGKTKNK